MMGPQEDYIETVFTCEGDYHDPHLKDRLEDFQKSLKDLLLTDKKKLILKKVEPWNSVRVTFKIPREAASRLKQLAQQGNATLRELGVLAVKIEDQNISLTIAGRNNERTQLVFRTGDAIQATTPSVSVYNTNSPSLDELGPQGPGPSRVDVTSKNIADYLRQGPSLLDSLFHQQMSEKHSEGAKAKVNNILSEHSRGQHRTFPQTATNPSHHNNPSTSSPSVNSVSPSRSPVGATGLKFPQLPGMPPGLPPGMPPGPPRHALDNLPPPPPYPEGSSYMNNLQKLRLTSAGTSPLLINLLQNDPSLSSLLGAGRLPPTLDPDVLQPPKKKRKPRKPKEKKKKEGELMSIPNAVIPGTSSEVPSSMSHATVSTHTSSAIISHSLNLSVKEQGFQNVTQALLHGKNIETEQNVPLTSPGVCRKEECDTAGKIINPVTGLLEPMDLSDTSPSKSDGDKNSPRSLSNKVGLIGDHKLDGKHGDIGHSAELQGRLENPNQGVQKQLTEQFNPRSVTSSEQSFKPLSSSLIGMNASSEILMQRHYSEAVKNDLLAKGRLKNDILKPAHSNLEQIVPKSEHTVTKERPGDKCDNISALELTKKVDSSKSENLPQEIDSRSIPLQLLNKPLLQVKHDSMIKSSGSPDSNGDSECSNLDTQNGPDTGNHPGPHLDVRSYNNDSGVGSCSERSDDTPSEHGDTDFKSGNHNSFECAKTPNIDSMKQAPPPNAKSMTVGYALEETQKNHKHVSEKAILNSVFERVKMKSEKLEMCSTSQSHQLHNNWSEESLQFANNVENRVKQAVYESIHRKSPKLSTNLPNSLHHAVEGQFPMQGPESSMQKKKSSPRNSPRGNCSPRNPGSPRNTGSPRGGGSPRSSEQTQQGANSRQSFRTNQDVQAHLLSRESHSKSPYSELGKSEQRRSPFHMLPTPHSVAAAAAASMSGILGAHLNNVDALHHVGVEPRTVSPQCNIDNIALLKSFEAYAQPHLSQLMAAHKDQGFLQTLEDLKPFFQKLQQHAASRTTTTSVANGLENVNHSSRPSASVSHAAKSSSAAATDLHSVSESSVMPNSLHAGQCNTNVLTTLKNDKESNSIHVHSKVNKVVTEEQKNVSSLSSRRSSPGAATSTSVSMHSFDSSLPPPKRLTESVQKLFPLPLLDTSLPHPNRRSPSSSASVTRTNSSHMASNNANTRGSAPLMSTSLSSSSTRNILAETPMPDIDSITPSITAVSIGPMNFHSDTSHKLGLDAINLEHKGSIPTLIDSQPVSLSYPSVVSSSATKLVPAVTGSIPSHKLGDSSGSSLKLSVTQNNGPKTDTTSSSQAVTSVSEIKTPVCNSETKMAGNSVVQSKNSNNSQISSTGTDPPILHPQSVRYPGHLNLEKPKSPFSHMGLSEMLQETANCSVPSVSTTTTTTTSSEPPIQIKTPKPISSSGSEKLAPGNFFENIQANIESQTQARSLKSETKQKQNCDEKSEKQKDSSGTGIKVGVEDSDIPKLKRQPSLSFTHKPGPVARSTLSSDSCDSDLNRSQDSCSSNNLTPPVLIAVSEIQEGKNTSETDPIVVKSEGESHTEKTKVTNSSVTIESPAGSGDKIDNASEVVSEQSVDVTREKPPTLTVVNDASILSGINSVHEDPETSNTVLGSQRHKSQRKRRASSESVEDKSGEAPRQLRSRKRTNAGENDGNITDDAKKLKLDPNLEVSNKTESANKDKNVLSVKPTYVSPVQETKTVEEPNTQTESIKSGLRTRTNSKNMPEEKAKPTAGRESRKDNKVMSGKGVVEKKAEVAKIEEMKRNQQTRRNRQSPSAPSLEKQAGTNVVREKSPLRGSRTRGRNSPVVMENSEESQENKRTTRSARSKETKAEGTSAPTSKVTTANKRRRTSQDHR